MYQLSLYKTFVAQKLDIPLNDISTYFVLLKRTGKDDMKLLELIRVTNGKVRMKNALDALRGAIKAIESGRYPRNLLSCQYCEFNFKKCRVR